MTTQHDFDQVRANGHEITGAGFGVNGARVITKPRFGWVRWSPQQRMRKERVPGRRLIGLGAWGLVALASGLLGVSYAAQYTYVLNQRHHQHWPSLIEAGCLDAGMIIFSLLALGLAMRGMSAKVERIAIVICAGGSAVMNYAAADVTSPRSVLAYCMPPVFLAFVADRVTAAYRRHVIGLQDTRSPWAVLGGTGRKTAKVAGLAVLYAVRVPLAPRSTFGGVRRAILAATPLPAAPQPPAIEAPAVAPAPAALPSAIPPPLRKPRGGSAQGHPGRGGTKTSRFLRLVNDKHGPMARIPLDQVGAICREQAPFVELDEGAARTALRAAIQAAADLQWPIPGTEEAIEAAGEGDVR
jgi:hypothetical protein